MILDSTGAELVASDGPKGNVGCPADPHEIDWFMEMLRRTRQELTDKDLESIDTQLRAFGRKILAR